MNRKKDNKTLTQKIGAVFSKAACSYGLTKREIFYDYSFILSGYITYTNFFYHHSDLFLEIILLKSKDTTKKRYFSVPELNTFKWYFMETVDNGKYPKIAKQKEVLTNIDDICFRGIVLSKNVTLSEYLVNVLLDILTFYPIEDDI